MFRYASCLAVLVVAAGSGQAATVPTGPVIAETGFNDAWGINSDGVANSPYQLGLPVVGQPPSEPGWAGPWTRTSPHYGPTMVQSSVTFEGDGAGAFSEISNTSRHWISPQDEQFIVECWMQFTADSLTAVYICGDDCTELNTAAQFVARQDRRVYVLDGVGDGSKPLEDTGFRWVPDEWHKFTQIIDYPNKTWRFFMDDVEYLAPDDLGFRGTPAPLYGINILSNVSHGTGVYLDHLRITAVPEPSALILLTIGTVGLLAYGWRRRN